MPRTAIRPVLSALAALALASALASRPAWPGTREAAEAQKYAADQQSGTKVKAPKSLAAKQGGTARSATERELMDLLSEARRNID